MVLSHHVPFLLWRVVFRPTSRHDLSPPLILSLRLLAKWHGMPFPHNGHRPATASLTHLRSSAQPTPLSLSPVLSSIDLHHTHVFASNIDAAIEWWSRHLRATVIFDRGLAGARNVFLAVGTGRLHLYDQPPRETGRGAVHHLGVRVTNLRHVWARLSEMGVSSPNGLRELDGWRYVMLSAPDNILVELFEFDDPHAPANINGPVIS